MVVHIKQMGIRFIETNGNCFFDTVNTDISNSLVIRKGR